MNGTETAETLARQARQALATTTDGTLHVERLDPVRSGDEVASESGRPDLAVLLYDDGGEPRFLCEPAAPLARAAGSGRWAVLDVSCCARGGCGRTVAFAGELAVLGHEDVAGTPVLVIGLALRSVSIEAPGRAPTDVALDAYRDAAADDLVDYAARVATHTNTTHAQQLRECAGRRGGRAVDDVLAAELALLDRFGAQLHWIGADGAHVTEIRFVRPADSPSALAALLRAALDGPSVPH